MCHKVVNVVKLIKIIKKTSSRCAIGTIARTAQPAYSAAGSAELESKDSISVQQKLEQLVEALLTAYPTNS